MYGAIILAAGQGSRFKSKKQFEIIENKEMWKYVYDKAVQLVSPQYIVTVGVDFEGGDTRSQSVRIGLAHLGECERVVILEAARPLVTVEQISALLESNEPSVTYALPLVNTVIGRDGTFYDRSSFYDLLTPQAFNYRLLKNAYETGKYTNTTDETYVMFCEYGIKPHFILEGENLFKVTYERDMDIINHMLKRQEKDENNSYYRR